MCAARFQLSVVLLSNVPLGQVCVVKDRSLAAPFLACLCKTSDRVFWVGERWLKEIIVEVSSRNHMFHTEVVINLYYELLVVCLVKGLVVNQPVVRRRNRYQL